MLPRHVVLLSLCCLLSPPLAWAQTVDDRAKAVAVTLSSAGDCSGLGDVYWEIGNGGGVLASGARGRITGDEVLSVASASKWLFGAYVVERSGGNPNAAEIAAMTMTSGYVGMNPLGCGKTETVGDCVRPGPRPGEVGKFHYDSNHDQHLAVTYGLGGAGGDQLAAEMRRVMGSDLNFTFGSPQPAGGGRISAHAYGAFLRKIINGQLKISGLLGSNAVCTLPGTCPQATSSPADKPWHYSLNHWVEDGPGDDGVFSSPGAFGFYPWISADKATYGILAREKFARGAWQDSARCGALLRKAWFEAAAQGQGAGQASDQGGQQGHERAHPLRDAIRERLRER